MASATTSPTSPTVHRNLTYRSAAGSISDDEAIPDTDPSDTAGILLERLQAWKHACGYLENYITATEKAQKTQAKEYDKILKSISDPLREGHHFDQSLGGIAGLFENMRANTQGIANSYLEVEKNLKGSVLPILTRLHSEIKSKSKELQSGAVKGSKAVATARNATQQHIERLGQHSAAYDSSGGKIEPHNDPYLLHRGIQHRLHRQVLEENNHRKDLLSVQDNFQTFEGHVVQTFQQTLAAFLQVVGTQSERQKGMYSDMVGTAQRIPLEFEWMNFLHRNGQLMIDPSAPDRLMSNIIYPNQDHASVKPLIEGTLERKSRAMGALTGFKTGYYAVSPSKYLHQFDDNDNFRKEPTPDLSLYLPDCVVGNFNGAEFNIKGKDVSKGKVGTAMQMTHEFKFKALTPADAEKWASIIKEAQAPSTGLKAAEASSASAPGSRVPSGQSVPPAYEEEKQVAPLQTQGLPQEKTLVSAGPQSATTPVPQSGVSATGGLEPKSAGTGVVLGASTIEPPTSATGKEIVP